MILIKSDFFLKVLIINFLGVVSPRKGAESKIFQAPLPFLLKIKHLTMVNVGLSSFDGDFLGMRERFEVLFVGRVGFEFGQLIGRYGEAGKNEILK